MSTSTDPVTPEPVLLRSDDHGIATLTLNRPAKYNALSEELLASMQYELDQIAKDETLRVVIIAAQGKAFCAGHDLKEMRASEDRAAPCHEEDRTSPPRSRDRCERQGQACE